MPRPLARERAKITDYVIEPRWEVDGMIACCSAEVVFRLSGDQYFTKEQAESEQDSFAEIDFINKCDARDVDETIARYVRDIEVPVPVEMAFAAVLEDMRSSCRGYGRRRHTRDVLFLATDNTTGRGDVETGPFCPRNLMQWLEDNDLATVQKLHTRRLVGFLISLNGHFTKSGAVVRKWTSEYNKLASKIRKKYRQTNGEIQDRRRRESPPSFYW